MIANPLVSILIPSYNAEKTIFDCIESTINQTYKNIEIIVVDDCSIDNTVNIINKIDNKKIKLIVNNHNLGMSRNWNECLKYANGEYIQFLHGDDILEPQCIEYKINQIIKDENINLVFSQTKIINENAEQLMIRKHYTKTIVFDGYKLAKKSFRTSNVYGEPSNVLFRKKVLNSVGLFSNTKYSTDWELWIKISTIGKCVHINKPLVKYRISTTNLTNNYKISDILKDDSIMIENLLNYKSINLTNLDIMIHKINILIRTLLRRIYLNIFAI